MEKTFTSSLRVRYAETDKMGVVHHGNYAQYFEIARIEWLANFGISYKSMEDSGVQLPVYEMNIQFKKPAFFDDKIEITTSLKEKPTAKIKFNYILRNQEHQILTIADTTLVFTDTEHMRPMRCPSYILTALGY